ncbi:MAG: hypothetical protein JWO35_479 [Candidatus Saccharibacteria bacterium]|nr:hypothetical protein [Candidatus Saccharibacteria bacterium]
MATPEQPAPEQKGALSAVELSALEAQFSEQRNPPLSYFLSMLALPAEDDFELYGTFTNYENHKFYRKFYPNLAPNEWSGVRSMIGLDITVISGLKTLMHWLPSRDYFRNNGESNSTPEAYVAIDSANLRPFIVGKPVPEWDRRWRANAEKNTVVANRLQNGMPRSMRILAGMVAVGEVEHDTEITQPVAYVEEISALLELSPAEVQTMLTVNVATRHR